MLFRSAASLSALQSWCRALRHGLRAGLPVTRVLAQQAEKGPPGLRDVADRVRQRAESGDSLEDALAPERDRLPELFVDMIVLGERTGHVPEIARELEEYYTLQQTMRRQFISQITWPVIQFVMGVLVVAGLILILGLIGDGKSGSTIAPFGLIGPTGAMIFLGVVFGGLAGLYGLYRLWTRSLTGRVATERLVLRLPAVGPCVEALSLQRFCLAMRLTLETGIPVHDALKRSLLACGNAAYRADGERVAKSVKKGTELTVALEKAGGFPTELVEVVRVGEESGELPEVLGRQSENYRELAQHRLKALTQAAGFAVYALVAVLIAFTIFSIYGKYIGMLNSFA